ncbi:hypothetical protein Q3G72_033470 [Acer saccharum]|nr:hypothetical protein Q3G72_033470 [Acer saccharum]
MAIFEEPLVVDQAALEQTAPVNEVANSASFSELKSKSSILMPHKSKIHQNHFDFGDIITGGAPPVVNGLLLNEEEPTLNMLRNDACC